MFKTRYVVKMSKCVLILLKDFEEDMINWLKDKVEIALHG